MSNETVERIVDLLFQNTEMTDEVKALYDETMSNCQERYQDMISHGVCEDDAISAVVESLKGMEEIIEQYPKKAAAQISKESKTDTADETESANTDVQTEYTFHSDLMKRIDMTLVCEDVHVDESSDDDVHVLLANEDAARAVTCCIENGVLIVRRNEDAPKQERTSYHASDAFVTAKKYSFTNDDKTGKQIQECLGNLSQDLGKHSRDGFASTVSRFGQDLGKLFSTIKPIISVSVGLGDVSLRIPHSYSKPLTILTTSGDIKVRKVVLNELRLTSASGELDVALVPPANLISLTTASGDITLKANAQELKLRSTSGDFDVRGDFRTLKAVTTSGDIELNGTVQDCSFVSVSGDLEAKFGHGLTAVNCRTTSGDIDIVLPDDADAQITTRSVSGDVSVNNRKNAGTAPVTGSVSTVTGDIDIR
jgi:hypothetical protein